jgi:ribosome-binding factor A
MHDRLTQIGSVLREAIQEVIQRGLNDPRIRGLVSITKVEVTPDLGEARVHVSVLPEQHARLTVEALGHAAGHIQSRIAPQLNIRRLPRLRFRVDESLKKQAGIDAALAQDRRPGAIVENEE